MFEEFSYLRHPSRQYNWIHVSQSNQVTARQSYGEDGIAVEVALRLWRIRANGESECKNLLAMFSIWWSTASHTVELTRAFEAKEMRDESSVVGGVNWFSNVQHRRNAEVAASSKEAPYNLARHSVYGIG